MLSATQKALGVGLEQTKRDFLIVFLFAHGYAGIIANNSLRYDEETIKAQLEQTYRGRLGSTGGNEMKKLYEKNELTLAIVWIASYCVLQSLANPLNKMIGVEYAVSAVFCILQAAVLFSFIRKNDLQKRYGLCKPLLPAWRFLYYVPLVILSSGNLWNGVTCNYSPLGTVCHIVCMLCVGFLEEVIFRGILFAAIARNTVKSAVVISSVTFGVGHIVNLFNGSGMSLAENLCQIAFAVVVGFLLVTIFYRGGSLLPCILAHAAINILSTFANDAGLSAEIYLLHIGILIVFTIAYTLILTKTLPKSRWEGETIGA